MHVAMQLPNGGARGQEEEEQENEKKKEERKRINGMGEEREKVLHKKDLSGL